MTPRFICSQDGFIVRVKFAASENGNTMIRMYNPESVNIWSKEFLGVVNVFFTSGGQMCVYCTAIIFTVDRNTGVMYSQMQRDAYSLYFAARIGTVLELRTSDMGICRRNSLFDIVDTYQNVFTTFRDTPKWMEEKVTSVIDSRTGRSLLFTWTKGNTCSVFVTWFSATKPPLVRFYTNVCKIDIIDDEHVAVIGTEGPWVRVYNVFNQSCVTEVLARAFLSSEIGPTTSFLDVCNGVIRVYRCINERTTCYDILPFDTSDTSVTTMSGRYVGRHNVKHGTTITLLGCRNHVAEMLKPVLPGGMFSSLYKSYCTDGGNIDWVYTVV